VSAASFALRMSVIGATSRFGVSADQTIKIGFLAPLTGEVSSWGQPGLNGSLIWVDWVNSEGGVLLNGRRHRIEIVSYDCGYDGERAMAGAKKLIQEEDVKFLMMLGGDTFTPIQEYVRQRKILTSTLLPSDLSPDTPYLIAPSEIHPIYNVTGVEWLAENKPHLKTVALCSQKDALGLPSLATYRAAFEATGIDIIEEVIYEPDAPDTDGIAKKLIASNPDILCWCTAYEPVVHALTRAAFEQGYKGQLLSCTIDDYKSLVEATSAEFMEGFVFQFPDFDDKMLNSKSVNFNRPNIFYADYNKRFPDSWTAVSWEYVSGLDLWRSAIEKAGTVEPVSVLAAMKHGGQAVHAFGNAQWWGEELFGINNALVGDWPVVSIKNGKAQIEEFRSTIAWCRDHVALLEKHMRALGQMWDQRLVPKPLEETTLPRHFSPRRTTA